MHDTANAKPAPGVRSILLGLFVLFELVYLPLSNLLQFVPREIPTPTGEFDIRKQREGTVTDNRPMQDAINGVGTFIDRYGELSGQVQYWSLFAPEFGRQTIFPVVEFEFGDGAERFRMRFEPHYLRTDPANYLRWPRPDSRLVGYEFLLASIYWDYSAESSRDNGPAWREAIREQVRRQQKSLEAYFRFSLAMLKRQHADLPEPRAGVLSVWIHQSPKVGESERPPAFTMPLARWAPDRIADGKRLAVEAYDPVEKTFVPLSPIE
jgi:hypothetical protein